MITLITGLPGTGKTTYAVSSLSKVKDRVVCFSGIPLTDEGKALGWLEVEKWTDAPEGALIVIDEAQRLFRPTQAGKAPAILVPSGLPADWQGLSFTQEGARRVL